jgi:sulfite reductase (NADPH) flavoprotein alpha-component
MSIPVLPPSAPFTTEQRAYLNGFFAGVFGLDGTMEPANNHSNGFHNNGQLSALGNGTAPSAKPDETDSEETPWHDPNLAIEERMALSEGKSLPLKMMAAMAQLDCGQCGYVCKTYAAAIADGSEKSLKKCVPGGKETSTKLKELMAL